MTQKSPALTTTPPVTVPESGGLEPKGPAGPVLHNVAECAWPLKAISAKPTIAT
jgi:hypothetical protein